MIDGIIISDNIEQISYHTVENEYLYSEISYHTVENEYLYSDHNPVELVFRLK